MIGALAINAAWIALWTVMGAILGHTLIGLAIGLMLFLIVQTNVVYQRSKGNYPRR